MADGFSVDRAALSETAQGINNTIGALKGLGFDETAEVGRGFSGLALSGLQAGDAGLQQALGGFCDRWSWGVRTLVQDGNQFAARLGLSAGVYADTEKYLVGVAKNVTDALVGDPHMTDAQAAQASWSQDAAVVTGAQTPEGCHDLVAGRQRGGPAVEGRGAGRTERHGRPQPRYRGCHRQRGPPRSTAESAVRATAVAGWQRRRGGVSHDGESVRILVERR